MHGTSAAGRLYTGNGMCRSPTRRCAPALGQWRGRGTAMRGPLLALRDAAGAPQQVKQREETAAAQDGARAALNRESAQRGEGAAWGPLIGSSVGGVRCTRARTKPRARTKGRGRRGAACHQQIRGLRRDRPSLRSARPAATGSGPTLLGPGRQRANGAPALHKPASQQAGNKSWCAGRKRNVKGACLCSARCAQTAMVISLGGGGRGGRSQRRPVKC